PEPYEAVCTITADFELAWAPRYSKSYADPLSASLQLARRERENIPAILQLCDQYHIPITFATVGHLFLARCQKENGKVHQEIGEIEPYENEHWKFEGNDWFEYDPGSNYQDAPEWYAPDLIEQILAAKTKHEIGCHTFSHIDGSDRNCPPELFRSEIYACKKEAERYGLTLESFVHPGHTIGNFQTLKDEGFSSFQTDYTNTLGYPLKHENGLWELKRTMEFVWRRGWSAGYHIYRYKKIVDRAIKSNTVCNFWFHPSFSPQFLTKVMPALFDYIESRRSELWFTTAGEYMNWLRKNEAI
ncbi:MAG: polysaccharide deacetylase family protein, partial [bacterium]|nr:polysaccharide deacetylase family protein [bacterium]